MGSFIEINDTLRISQEQGFPAELDIAKHLQTPISLDQVADKTFSFSGKPKIRLYKVPPVRNFLVQEIDGKWLYWGLCLITEVNLDYEHGITSGKFKVIRLNTPDEMRQMFELVDTREELNYFNK